jgi:hypothetical protein
MITFDKPPLSSLLPPSIIWRLVVQRFTTGMKHLLLPLMLSLALPAFAQEPEGLILKFKMDGSCELTDETAFPAGGVLVDVTATTDVHNHPNAAFNFTLSSSYITLGVVDKLKLAGDKTITFWIKPTLAGNRTGSVFIYGNGIVIGYQEASSVSRLNVSFGGTQYMQVPLTANEWHAVTITFEKNYTAANSRAIAYIDGVQVQQAERAKSEQTFTNALALMGPATQTWPIVNGFRGSLDGFKVYNRALSAAEVSNAILPAKLEFIKAKRIDDVVELHWKTSLEDNVSHFDVQKSSDGINFQTIGKVNAGKYDYLFYETNNSNGETWYRLQTVDRDGKTEFSRIVKVGPATETSSIRIFPNPATTELNFSGILNNYTVTIVSPAGTILKQQQPRDNKVFLTGLRPGLYYVIIYDNNGNKKLISKFIKR